MTLVTIGLFWTERIHLASPCETWESHSPTTCWLGSGFTDYPSNSALWATPKQQHRAPLASHQTSPQESWLRQSLSSDEKPPSRSKYYTLAKQQVVLRAGEQMTPGSRDLHRRAAYLISNKIQTLISSLVRCELWSKVLVNSIYFLCDSLETNTVGTTFLPLSPRGHELWCLLSTVLPLISKMC